jgi:endonuclease G
MRWLVLLLVVAVILAAAFAVAVLIRADQLRHESTSAGTSSTPEAPRLSPGTATDIDDNDPLGLPISSGRSLQILHKRYFTVGYDNAEKEPAWVSYHLAGPIRYHGHEHRPDKFAIDPEVQNPGFDEDYTGTHYDRGHMCPAYAIFSRGGQEAMLETFITSNIVPQVHGLNAGSWEKLEVLIAGRDKSEDGWAGEFGDVWVTDGPVVTKTSEHLALGEPVPESCFMIVLRRVGSEWKSLAFEMPNQPERKAPAAFLVSIRRVEQDTGLDFDSALPTGEQKTLEEGTADDVWP